MVFEQVRCNFQVSCMKFLNRFVETSTDMREKIMIQTELEEAGFEPVTLNKFLLGQDDDGKQELLKDELNRWTQNYVDVHSLVKKLLESERTGRGHREELSSLKDQLRESQAERQKLVSAVEKLKMKCERLEAVQPAATTTTSCAKCDAGGILLVRSDSSRKPQLPPSPETAEAAVKDVLNKYDVFDPDVDDEDDDVMTIRRPPQAKKLVICKHCNRFPTIKTF